MVEKEEKPAIEQLADQLLKATELSKTLLQPYRSIHRELNDVFEKVKVAVRKRSGSTSTTGSE